MSTTLLGRLFRLQRTVELADRAAADDLAGTVEDVLVVEEPKQAAAEASS